MGYGVHLLGSRRLRYPCFCLLLQRASRRGRILEELTGMIRHDMYHTATYGKNLEGDASHHKRVDVTGGGKGGGAEEGEHSERNTSGTDSTRVCLACNVRICVLRVCVYCCGLSLSCPASVCLLVCTKKCDGTWQRCLSGEGADEATRIRPTPRLLMGLWILETCKLLYEVLRRLPYM